ncbi:MAG: translation elongation factor 4 [Patescibacteria group bacterium]
MKIRNFVIIAHIDHGKSTLADRFLEVTGTVEKRLMKEQYLDQLESERERGITIKMAPVRMKYKDYVLNLIDTPGHSDFGYEVSRALAAVEGAILLVDVSQGIQAQTLANFENAKKSGLKIIGAVNKIDLDLAHVDEIIDDLANLIGVDRGEIIRVSGKTGQGVEELLDRVIEEVPSPKLMSKLWVSNTHSRALIFDSLYDDHKGIIAFVRVFDGNFAPSQGIKFLATGVEVKIKEVGYFYPKLKSSSGLTNGEIGYIATGIKEFGKIKIGDTLLRSDAIGVGEGQALPGFKNPQPVVFVSFYPEESDDYENLKQALAKLRLTDASLNFEPDTSEVLGRGFKGGFLGRLHFEITAERLAKEFKINTVHSFPSVSYKIIKNKKEILITNPKDFLSDFDEVLEPIVKVEIITPSEYLGRILSLKEFFRFENFETINLGKKLLVTAKLPLADLISDLDDKLKSLSAGYASLSYEIIGYKKGDLEKLEILIADHLVAGLTRILPKEKIQREARQTVERLKELLPKQQFVQAIQAAVRGKIIARETIPAMKKDVTGYLYGGDRTRKMKLWKKQQRGKVRLKERAEGGGNDIRIPASIFKELLKK